MNTFSLDQSIIFTHTFSSTTNNFIGAKLRTKAHQMGVKHTAENLCGVIKITVWCDTPHEHNILTKMVEG